MKKTLRPYQQAAFNAVIADESVKSLVILPTGSGKSLLIAALADHYDGKIIVIQPALDLVEQNSKEFIEYTDDTCSICCASLGSKEHDQRVVFATIGSLKNHVYQDATIIIDEAHRLTPLLLSYISRSSPKKIIGLTATPFRLDIGYIFGEGKFFTEITYEALVSDLIEQDFLANISVRNRNHSKYSYVIKDFDKTKELSDEEVDMAFIKSLATPHIVKDLLDQHRKRGGVLLIFAANVEHAYLIQSHIDEPSYVITHKTNTDDRIDQIEEVKLGEGVTILINVSTLTTGINIPNIRTIGLLRFTSSSTLVGQMIGRGLRKSDGKVDCLVVDYADNIDFHKIAPTTIITPNINRIAPKEDNVKLVSSDLESLFPNSTIFYPISMRLLKNHVEYICTDDKKLRVEIADSSTRLGIFFFDANGELRIDEEFSILPYVIVVKGQTKKQPRITNMRGVEYVQFIDPCVKSVFAPHCIDSWKQSVNKLIGFSKFAIENTIVNSNQVFIKYCDVLNKCDPNIQFMNRDDNSSYLTRKMFLDQTSVIEDAHRRSLLLYRLAEICNVVAKYWTKDHIMVTKDFSAISFVKHMPDLLKSATDGLITSSPYIVKVSRIMRTFRINIENSDIAELDTKNKLIAAIVVEIDNELAKYAGNSQIDALRQLKKSKSIAESIVASHVVLTRVGELIECSETAWDRYYIDSNLT